MGWNRVHTALRRCSSANMLTEEKEKGQEQREKTVDSLHEEKVLLLCNHEQLVQLFDFETSRLLEDVCTSQQNAFCVTVVEDMWGAYVDGCSILLVRAVRQYALS